MIRRNLILAASLLVLGAAPASAGGDDSYQVRHATSPFYVGAVVGYGWGKVVGGGASISTRGVIGGGVVGYRVLTGNTALAIEGDIMGSGIQHINTERNEELVDERSADTSILASLRLKAAWGQAAWRPYLTGGVAWQHVETAESTRLIVDNRAVRISESETDQRQFGYTVGAGIDWQADDLLGVSLGYHYYRFDGSNVATNLHTIRLGGSLHY